MNKGCFIAFKNEGPLSSGQECSSTQSTWFPLNHRFILVSSQDEALPLKQLKCNQQILTGRHKYAIRSTFGYFSVTLLLTECKSIILWLFMLKNATSSCTLFFCFIILIFSKSYAFTDLYIKYNVSHYTYVEQ